MPTITRFRPELLPPARAFYERELGELGRSNRGWAKPKSGCPFHPSKSKQSFSVNLADGHWHCFGCDTGGDMIDFVRRRYNLTFREAKKYLGVDDDHRPARRPTIRERWLVLDYVIDGVPYRAEVRDEPKNDLQRMRRIHHEAADRLKELREGDAEIDEGEGEIQWSILSLSWELIEMEVGQ